MGFGAMDRHTAFGAVLLCLSLAACGGEDSAEKSAEGPAVEVATVVPVDRAEPIIASGTLELKREVPLSFKIGGILDQFAADEGDAVKAGDVLAQLVDVEIDARERDAEASLAQAERELARAKALFEDGVVSTKRVEDAETGVARARAALDAVSFDRRFSRILAPADGIVLRRSGETNQLIAPGATVFVIGDLASGFILSVAVSDRDIVRLGIDDPAEVSLAATGDEPIAGWVQRLSAKADAATGHFDVEVRLEADAATLQRLRSGMIGRATLRPRLAAPDAKLLAVPAEAIVEGNGAAADLMVVGADDIASLRSVAVAGLSERSLIVAAGLSAGERVITSGAAYVKDGERVRIIERLAEGAGAAPASAN